MWTHFRAFENSKSLFSSKCHNILTKRVFIAHFVTKVVCSLRPYYCLITFLRKHLQGNHPVSSSSLPQCSSSQESLLCCALWSRRAAEETYRSARVLEVMSNWSKQTGQRSSSKGRCCSEGKAGVSILRYLKRNLFKKNSHLKLII